MWLSILFLYRSSFTHLLTGEDLSNSYWDLTISCSVLALRSITLSLLLSVALICSSVCTNLSNSTFKSLFWPPRTLQCDWIASISDFKSAFLSIRLLLLNLRFSYSFLDTANWSSVALNLVSLSKRPPCKSLFLASSFSACLCISAFWVNCPSRFLWRAWDSTISLEWSSLVLASSAPAESRASVVLLHSKSLASASFESSWAFSWAL